MGISEFDLIYIFRNLNNILPILRNSTIFVSGGTGFIGKWLLESILYANKNYSLDIRLTVLCRHTELFKAECPHLAIQKEITLIAGDIMNFNFPDEEYDFIIHAATEANAKLNVENPLLMSDVIINGTRHLLNFAIKCNAKRILFLSTGGVYGKQANEIKGFKEDYFGAPNQLGIDAAYSESKRIAEFLCAAYARQFGINISIARCFAFVGPYLPLNTHYAIGNFINDGLQGRDICITGDGSPLRSYMYASDMIVWLLTILLKGNNGEAYNVGSEEPVSIKDLAMIVANFFPGIKVKILNQVRLTDRNQNYIPDIQKAKSELYLVEGISLKDAICKTIQFHKQNE